MQSDTDHQRPRMTPEFFKKLLRKETKLYYSTPYLNDILYLHYKGFNKIENMEVFTGLKCLYAEGNGFSVLEGLQCCTELKCLYIQENCLTKLENLEELKDLRNCNFSDNWIEVIEGFDSNPSISSLQLKRNRIGVNGLKDIEYLPQMKSCSCLDVSDNKIDAEDPEDVIKILESMPNLKVLYMFGNPIVSKISSYRKTLIARLPLLKFLDDRPVFPEDRIFAEAFYAGGLEAEREARKQWKIEKEEERVRNFRAFREMVNVPIRGDQYIPAKKDDDESSVGSKVDSEEAKNLDTYYSSSLQESSKNETSEGGSASKKENSETGVLKESDSINRTTPNDTDESSLDSRSKGDVTSEDSKSERLESEEKSDSSSVKSVHEESEIKENKTSETTAQPQPRVIDEECHFFDQFENHLTALD